MNVLNISRLGNQIKGLKVIGINDSGNIILSGCGEMSDFFPGVIAKRMMFYEYNPVTDELEADIFSGLNTLDLLLCDNAVKTGKNYFIEATDDNKVSIVYCDFNRRICERLFTICTVGGSSVSSSKIQLIPLTGRYFAIKAYNKSACEIYIYDKQQHKRYDLLFPENDDMRYAGLHCITIDETPYIIFMKQGKSDWKAEYYIHRWEWTPEFINYKDEKLFAFPLQGLVDNKTIYLNEAYMIAQADENNTLYYHTAYENCIIYSRFDHRVFDKEDYEHRIFFFDIKENRIAKSIPYYSSTILTSNKGHVYQYAGDLATIRDLVDGNTYKAPYENALIRHVIDHYMLLNCGPLQKDKRNPGIIIYDMENEREAGRYYTEDKKLYLPPKIRSLAVGLNGKYFENEDLLILY